MDADSTSRKNTHDDLLSAFRAGKADVLLGTQMIAKGLDFPNVTLVGVLNADTSLNMPDFRAAERTFQLVAQVSGRAGRAEKPGEVYVQTFSPGEPAVKAAAEGDYAGFAAQELKDREAGFYPPYCRLATLLFRSKDEAAARAWAEMYAASLKTAKGLKVSDATPAALERAEGWFRYQVLLRAATAREIGAAYRWISRERPAPKDVRIAFDMDAQSMA